MKPSVLLIAGAFALQGVSAQGQTPGLPDILGNITGMKEIMDLYAPGLKNLDVFNSSGQTFYMKGGPIPPGAPQYQKPLASKDFAIDSDHPYSCVEYGCRLMILYKGGNLVKLEAISINDRCNFSIDKNMVMGMELIAYINQLEAVCGRIIKITVQTDTGKVAYKLN